MWPPLKVGEELVSPKCRDEEHEERETFETAEKHKECADVFSGNGECCVTAKSTTEP